MLLLLLSACQPEDVKPGETGPTVAIESPGPRSLVRTGEAFEALGTATDPDDGVLDVTWDLDGDPVCVESGRATGDTTCSVTASAGDHVLTLTATDSAGATDHASVAITAANGAAPEVIIESPINGDYLLSGEYTTLRAHVADADTPLTELIVHWSLYPLGALSDSVCTDTGLCYSEITEFEFSGEFDLTATVEDPDGNTDAHTIIIISNLAPAAPSVEIVPAEPTGDDDLTVTVVQEEDPDEDVITHAYAWYRDDQYMSAQTWIDAAETEPGDLWYVTVTPNDGHQDGPAAHVSVHVINGRPTIEAVTITPGEASAEDVLTCSWSGYEDPEGDPDASNATWDVGGVVVGTGTQLSGAFARGDTVTCTVTPNDGYSDGSPLTDSVVIENSVPTIQGLTLTPDPATTTDTLVASSIVSDADGDSVTISYAWEVNGAATGGATDSLEGSYFARGDVVVVSATPTDSFDVGTAVTSSGVTIANTAPSAVSATISPDPAVAGDNLTCSLQGFSDADGDGDQSTIAWTVDGVAAGSGANPSVRVSGGMVVECTATPFDGSSAGAAVTAVLTVSNSAPFSSNVSISPSNPGTDDTVTAVPSAIDPDDDTLSWGYEWYVNGTLVSTSGETLDGTVWFGKGQVIQVVATPDDGTAAGTPATSNGVNVVNSVPGSPGVAISPTEPVEGTDPLVCEVVASSFDADGDGVTYTVAWTVDGVEYHGTRTTWPDDTVDALDTVAAETWTCTVTPNDGDNAGPSSEASVTILGQPVDYAHVQSPCAADVTGGDPVDVHAWVYLAGVTDVAGWGDSIAAEAGVGPEGSYPEENPDWTWQAATYFADQDGPYEGDLANDEYVATLTAPAIAGIYNYAFRVTTDGGLSWTYVDLGGDVCGLTGTTDGYDPATAGVLTVN